MSLRMRLSFRRSRRSVARSLPPCRPLSPPAFALPMLEPLEPRLLLSGTSYVVNSLANTLASDGLLTLREAIQAASTNKAVNEAPAGSATAMDTITFAPALFAAGPASIILSGSALSITGALTITGPGPDVLAIDAAGRSGVFLIQGTGTVVVLDGLKVTGGGTVSLGGGLWCHGGSLAMTNCTVSENSASYGGGGLYCSAGTVALTDCTVSENSAPNDGGGLYCSAGTVALTDCTVSRNTAPAAYSYGGGIFAYSGCTLTMTDSTVSRNSASSGGGLYAQSSTVTLTNCTISGNTASSGGGLYAQSGTVTLANSTVSGNSASSGGGVDAELGTVRLANCTVSKNSAFYYGGGLFTQSGTVALTNCTVTGNSATWTSSSGGGVYGYMGTVTLTNCTVSGNSASSYGGGLRTYSIYLGMTTLDNTLVATNVASSSPDNEGTYVGSANFVGGDPRFVRDPAPGPDGVWGTGDDDPGDLHLRPDSPCVDAGLDALAVDADGNPLTVDLDGNPRIYGASVDIGAYEFRPAVVARRTFYNNSYFDGDDPAANAADDDAIAPDKVALLPGQTATFANCTTYSRGINGIMVDIAGLADPAGLTPATLGSYFTFRVGNDNDPDAWSLAPTPSAVLVRLGAGEGGGDRIEIIWADNAIQAQWLQVTVLANDHTGLADDDVFYFGNLPGDATGDGVVGVGDYLTVKWQYGTTVPLPGSKADFDCSGDVGRGDLAAVGPRFGQSINLAFSPPAVVVAAEATAPAAPDPAPAEPGEPGAPAEPAGPAEPAEPTVEPAPADPAPAGPAEATAPEGATVPAAETPAMEGPGAFVEPVTPSAETAEPIRLPAPSEEAPNADVLAAATGILGTPPVSDPQNVAVAPAPEAITPLAADVLWCLPATSLPQPGAADALAVLTPGALPQRSASPADAWAALSLPPIRFTGPLRSASASWLSTRQGDAPRRWAGDALQQAAAVRSDDATAQSAGTETWATTLAATIADRPRTGRLGTIALDLLACRK